MLLLWVYIVEVAHCCGDFCGIPGDGARTVCFEQADGRSGETGIIIGALKGFFLAFTTRGIDALEAAIAGSAKAPDDRVNAVAVAFSIFQTLEDHHADAFADHHSIGVNIERARDISPGKRRCFAEIHVHDDGVIRINPTSDHHICAAFDQFTDRQTQCAHRTGAGSVGHTVDAAEIEAVGDATGDDITEHPGERIFFPADIGQLDLFDDDISIGLREAAA